MPDFNVNNVHSVEFEAPLSSDSIAARAPKHFSIDLSLELERQLDMESFPPTPAHLRDTHVENHGSLSSRESLDPQVLAHIVKQLQQSLAEMTRDRDELRETIASSHAHEAELQDALQHMIDKATSMEVELTDARKKIKEDEETINLLRAKVEESRRGLMRLQAESRRQSLAPVDISRAAGLASLGSPPSRKDGTFTPMTGSFTARPGHRRIASVNDSPTNSAFDKNPTFSFPNNASSSHPPSTTRRHSGLFGRTSPSQLDVPSPLSAYDELNSEVDALRKELRSVKDVLERTRHDLAEANEAKEASETCVKVLREFIGENNVGAIDPETASVTSLKLPPPPTMAHGEEDEESAFPSKKTAPVSTWGFGRLWGDSAKAPIIVPQSATIAPSNAVPSSATSVPKSATPMSRKFGGFFSRTSSISSATSPHMRPTSSIHSNSDSSSVAEPASPSDEFSTNVVVRDATSLSDSSPGNTPDIDKEVKIDLVHTVENTIAS
ncbi:hypothetical protein H0H93_011747 [Arthromyces matolae]|nr:hypothetical protein H0H93_011747 [Arthromyces matolae]